MSACCCLSYATMQHAASRIQHAKRVSDCCLFVVQVLYTHSPPFLCSILHLSSAHLSPPAVLGPQQDALQASLRFCRIKVAAAARL